MMSVFFKKLRSQKEKIRLRMSHFFKGLWSLKVEIILWTAIIVFIISVACSFFHHFNCWETTQPFLCWKSIPFFLYLNKGQLVTYGMGLLAVIVVYSQLISLRDQLQLQALMEYSKQWNSKEMKETRKTAMNILKLKSVSQDVNIDPLEQVLELLEDFSSLANNKVIDQKLVWKSSLGWYACRYFYYSRENKSIKAIRCKWCSESQKDDTYYEELESLYKQYLDNEVGNVMKLEPGSKDEKRGKIEQAYYDTKDKFVQAELGFTNDK
jgi:hypothetical protein